MNNILHNLFICFKNSCKPALYWHYSTNILCLINKIKSLTLKDFIIYIGFCLLGVDLLFKYMHFGQSAPLAKDTQLPYWICTLYVLIKILFTSSKLPLLEADLGILTLIRNNINIYLLYYLLGKITNIVFPLLVALLYARTYNSLKGSIFVFLTLYLFFLFAKLASFLVKLIKLNYPNGIINMLIKLITVTLILASINGIYRGITFPWFISSLFYPMQLLLLSFSGHIDFTSISIFSLLVLQSFLTLALLLLCICVLCFNTYQLTFEDSPLL